MWKRCIPYEKCIYCILQTVYCKMRAKSPQNLLQVFPQFPLHNWKSFQIKIFFSASGKSECLFNEEGGEGVCPLFWRKKILAQVFIGWKASADHTTSERTLLRTPPRFTNIYSRESGPRKGSNKISQHT